MYEFTIYAIYVPKSQMRTKKIPPHAEGPSCKKFYTSNYFLAAVSTLAVVSAAAAAVSTVVAAESVAGSVEAPPQAANAAIAKIANTFFI